MGKIKETGIKIHVTLTALQVKTFELAQGFLKPDILKNTYCLLLQNINLRGQVPFKKSKNIFY